MFRRRVQDYWLPTPFASFPFTSPPVRHRVPPHSVSALLTYTPGVCVFPARSTFTPGWVYVHVGGGAMCLISPILGTCIVGVCCVLHCTGRPHSQNTMSLCWECNLLLVCTTIYSLKKLRYIIAKFSLVLWLCTVFLIWCVFCLTDGPQMYPVVLWHYTVAVYCCSAGCSCFLLCTAIVHCKTFVALFIEFLVYLSLLFNKHTVVFTLCARGGFFYTICIVITDVYYYCLCQFLPCWKGCGGPELGWVSVCHSVGRVLVGAGWDGLLWLVGF